MTAFFDFLKKQGMKLYQTIDGTLIGFYKEMGGEVQAVMYRDIYESQVVTKTREERTWIQSTERTVMILMPGFWEERTYKIPGRWERRAVRIPEHQEWKTVEIPGHYDKRTEWVPGHYEIRPYWFEEHTVTKYYWREAHPARGLKAAWIPYEVVIPAGFQDTRVWIEGEWQTETYWVDTTWEDQWVTIPEDWGTEKIWIKPVSRTRKVWHAPAYRGILVGEPGRWETKIVEYYETVKVWTGYEPVYEFVDPERDRVFEVIELVPAPADRTDIEDAIVIKNLETGEELTTTATYIGLAEQIDDNEYVVP